MRIILRLGQRLDRRISGNKLAGRRTGLFHRLKVHINSTFITHQLHFSVTSSIRAGIPMLRAMETKKISRLCASAVRAFHTPSEVIGEPPSIAILVHTDIFGNPCNQLHRIGKVSSRSCSGTAFSKNPLLRSNHFVAHTRDYAQICGNSTELASGVHEIYHVGHYVCVTHCEGLWRKSAEAGQCRPSSLVRTETGHKVTDGFVVTTRCHQQFGNNILIQLILFTNEPDSSVMNVAT